MPLIQKEKGSSATAEITRDADDVEYSAMSQST